MSSLDQFRAKNISNLFVVGTFEKKVTVLHQQTRALNLVHAFVEAAQYTGHPLRIAIIGAGFAGLTAASGFIKKLPDCELTIFERRDTLMPLQQGSDARWLHPRIYDWPDEGSESKAAMLPLMNWTAGRASDVAVQLATQWKDLASGHTETGKLRLFCNTRHLKIAVGETTKKAEELEWIGEPRDPRTGGMLQDARRESSGEFERFHAVVLCVGFGLEDEATHSYWRNETLAQPELTPGRQTYLISGVGDGGIVDLLRVRISNFRQDRILSDLFEDDELSWKFSELKSEFNGSEHVNLFARFNTLLEDEDLGPQFQEAIDRLRSRLRRDSGAVLNTRKDSISAIFADFQKGVSFQNSVLLFMLYKAGGFVPTCDDYSTVKDRYAIADKRTIVRHGTDRHRHVGQLLAGFSEDEARVAVGEQDRQIGDEIGWPGGYFGFPGKWDERSAIDDEELRKGWRKEYLPDATQIASATLCASVAGIVRNKFPTTEFRITFHRSLLLYHEPLLQQCCEYVLKDKRSQDTAGRTFRASSASIGLSYRLQEIIRTKRDVSHEELYGLMDRLALKEAARAMRGTVRHIACIPILQDPKSYIGDSRVAGILYLDSDDPDAYFDDDFLKQTVAILGDFARMISGDVGSMSDVRNVPLTRHRFEGHDDASPLVDFSSVFDVCSDIGPASLDVPLQINLDETSFKSGA